FVERALVLNSNLTAAWGFSGWIKACLGDPDTAINHAALAMRLSPRDPRMFAWQSYTALAHFCAGRYDEAAASAERALRDQPNIAPPMLHAAASHALAGRLTEAGRILERIHQLHPALRLSNLGDLLVLRRPDDQTKYVEG